MCRVLENNTIEFDNNKYLFAFNNKIYDLQSSKFIEPHYKQYISLTTGYNWVSGYNTSYKEKLHTLLSQIFPDPELKDFYLECLSTRMYGETIQHFIIAKGVGGNGKSVINTLMMESVGNYGYRLPDSVLTKSIQDGANPAIANMSNKRFVLVEEPKHDTKICATTMKKLTGTNDLNCRTLYSTDTKTRLKTTLLCEANGLPALDVNAEAEGRRMLIATFQSQFMTFPAYNQLTEEEKQSGKYYLANPYYSGNEFQTEYKQALIEILMDSFKKFQNQNYVIHPPQQAVNEATEYMKFGDDFYGWFNSMFLRKKTGKYYLLSVFGTVLVVVNTI